jgi:hypothetical protein
MTHHLMRHAIRIAFVTLLVGVPAFFFRPVLLPASIDGPAMAMPGFVASLLFALSLGLGIALLLAGRHGIKAAVMRRIRPT